jgi:pyruvate dehydrogenase E2 component (dihydrolipoamide acetyltransferase)
MADRAREGRATLDELRGSTITITNVGAIGGVGFTPIINYPEVAILGLAQARVQPVARPTVPGERSPQMDWAEALNNGYEFAPRLMMPVVLAFDHRVNDGAEAQRFLNHVIGQLAHPERLLMGL